MDKENIILHIKEKMLFKDNNITEDMRKKFKGSLKKSPVKDFLVDLILTKQNTIIEQENEIYRLRRENQRLESILSSRI